MVAEKSHSLNYYFLSEHLHPSAPRGFQPTLCLLIVNKNDSAQRNKFLIIREDNGWWGFPQSVLEDEPLIDTFFEAIIKNLGKELGFKGVTVKETGPIFVQQACLFNLDKQIYDGPRSRDEKAKKRPSRGKIYHLAIMTYRGTDELPIETGKPDSSISDYRWVNEEEGRELVYANERLREKGVFDSQSTVEFNKAFYNHVINIYYSLNRVRNTQAAGQRSLF